MANELDSSWSYKSEASEESNTPDPVGKDQISWTASEFIQNDKDARWHMGFYVVLALVIVLTFVFTRDYFSAIIIAIVGVLFVFLANRKPRQIPYHIDYQGVGVGSQIHPFSEFKSFSVAHEGAIAYINLMPLKRFLPEVSLYYPPDQEQEILEILTAHLPHDQQPERLMDRLAKKIHF